MKNDPPICTIKFHAKLSEQIIVEAQNFFVYNGEQWGNVYTCPFSSSSALLYHNSDVVQGNLSHQAYHGICN